MNLKLKEEPLLLTLFGIAALETAVGAFALLLAYPALPQEVPLLFTAGSEISAKIFLWAVPVLSIFFLVLDAITSEVLARKREGAAALFPAFISVFVSAILTSALVRILRIFPFPTSALENELYPLVLPLSTAIILGLVATVATRALAGRLHLFDKPHGPYPQVRPIPRLGAIPLFLTFCTTALLFSPIDNALKGVLLGAALITLIQTLDDLHPLPFWLQGLGHVIAGLAVVLGGIKFTFIGNPFWPYLGEHYFNLNSIPYLSVGLTVIWVFALTNVVDWLDGLDGLAAGIGTIASLAIVAISILLKTPVTATLGIILVGTLIGFLPLNFFPAQIYLGGGAFLLGYLLAALSIFSGAKTGTALLILAIPIIDALFVILSRVRSGKSPFFGDKSHLHHRLMKIGLGHPQIVLLEWGTVAAIAIAAVVLRVFAKFAAIGLVFLAALLVNRLLLLKAGSKTPKEAGHAT